MRIVFLGTPDFAVPSLKAVAKSKHELLAVITQPDKPVGRKAILTPSPVKACAQSLGVKVLQYSKIRLEGVEDLKALAPDIMVTCAFGQILSKEILEIAPRGVINVHASLLPKYRGAAPIQHAIINGEAVSGVTIMQTEEGIDTGDILAVKEVPIGENETAGELFDRLSTEGAELLCKTLDDIESGRAVPVKQDESKATYVKTISKTDALIDWSKRANEIKNLVRGMNPWPIAYTFLHGKMLKIYSAEVVGGFDCPSFGKVVKADRSLVISCGKGALKVCELQLEGGKAMPAEDFLRGRNISEGDVLGNG
ncbi:MAG: methionyl-tRNA formyltransferase [Clostridia bacterium]|nr:methionyl-tRNA formyltransferase [Clostridia bacterium]